MPTVVHTNTAQTTRAQRVYTRRKWSDAWTLQPYLHCVESTWSVSPSIPTATLVWRFGDSIMQPDDSDHEFTFYDWLSINTNHFVKIEFDTDDPLVIRKWVGTCEITEEQYGGIAPYHGEQTITCYGMEKLLDSEPVVSTIWYDTTAVTNQITSRAHTFNRGGIGNKSPSVHGTSYVFYPDLDTAQKWNSREIVEYLIATQKPKDKDGGNPIDFFLTAAANTIPTFDEPEIEQEGQTLYSLLDRIINRHRLLVWYLNYVENTNAMEIKVMTMAVTDVSLPGTLPSTIAANSSQLDWQFDGDALTSHAVKLSDVEKVDQVVCQGAPILSVGSFSITDVTLEKGWVTTEETAYEAGASLLSGYGDLDRKEKQKRNAEVRDAPKLEKVYSVFVIPKMWNRKVKDGEGGTAHPFFPIVDPTAAGGIQPESYPVYYATMFIEQTLPLIVGGTYADDAIEAQNTNEPLKDREEMSPLLFFKRPGSASPVRWILGDRIGDAADLERTDDDEATFSVHMTVPHESQSIKLRVTGKPQHAIAKTDFAKLADDKDLATYEYLTMVVTLAIADDRKVEGVWPATISVAAGTVVKKKYLNCGERYRKTYVCPGTWVDIDPSGTPKKSDGGFIPFAGDEDDEHKLTTIARIAYEWYGRTRYVMAVETYRMPDTDDVQLGMLVTAIGNPAGLNRQIINSIITQIQIRAPLGSGQVSDPCPTMHVVTWAGELDPMQLAPKYLEPVRRDYYRDEKERYINRPADRYGSYESEILRPIAGSLGRQL